MVVRIGEYNLGDSNLQYPHIDMRVAERIIHEKFNFLTFENDIALLRLPEAINLAPHIIPICIAPYKNYTGSMATISGWGRLSQGTHMAFDSRFLSIFQALPICIRGDEHITYDKVRGGGGGSRNLTLHVKKGGVAN